ncbi:hypothetical protein MTP99_013992 [Tenebrio molitor]|nr:hypothetical protein MTP99_013992 [Tenebrio molitor]
MVSMDDNILAAVGCVIAVHHDTYLHQLLLLVTPFVAKEDTIMTTHIRKQETGKIQPQGGNFVWDFCVSPTHRGLKDAATHVEEFLKAWTVQVEP